MFLLMYIFESQFQDYNSFKKFFILILLFHRAKMVRNARSRAQRLNARNRAARRAQELPQGMAIQDEAARREEARERHNRRRR